MAKPPHHSPLVPDEWRQRADDFARREPAKAVASAFGAGYLLSRLPLIAITAALTGIAFSLIRPTLLVLGLLKVSEFLRTPRAPAAPPELRD